MERRSYRLFAVWVVWATICVWLMMVFPGQETVPYHLGYAGLALAFGLETWSNLRAYAALAAFTTISGVVLLARAGSGEIAWGETTEIPLMCLLMALMVWHVGDRHDALATVTRLAERDREQALRRERIVRLTSHEMRTPLTIATGYVDLMWHNVTDSDQARDLVVVQDELERISRACDRLLRMIRYHEDVPTREVDLDNLLTGLEQRWRVVEPRTWSIDAAAGTTLCSEERLRACLDTLVENALRYTSPGDPIRIFGRRHLRHITLGVADGGEGLTPQQMKSVNEDTQQVQGIAPPVDERSGTGLGLSLVREIIESRGGEVRACRAPEGGAMILLNLPLVDVYQPPQTNRGPIACGDRSFPAGLPPRARLHEWVSRPAG